MSTRSTVVAAGLLLASGCPKPTPTEAPSPAGAAEAARAFVDQLDTSAAPIARDLNLAYWDATTTGDSAAFQRASELDLRLRTLYADAEGFARLSAWSADPAIASADPLLARRVLLAKDAFAPNQIDPELMARMVALGTEVEEIYSTHRGTIDGREVDENEILDILGDSTDRALRQQAWEASKQVGPLVAEKLLELVKLRNEAARQAGYPDYYQMSLTLSEQDPATIKALFADMAERSRGPFEQLKATMDARIAGQLGVTPADLRPWDYADPFFQEAPQVSDHDLDAFFKGRDVAALVAGYFDGIGLDTHAILARSDLYPREKKQPSAYCTDIDREGDVRIFCNTVDDEYWASTILHELGHAVYSAGIDRALPWGLRNESHPFTTEAVALLFGRLSKDPSWIHCATGLPMEEIAPAAQDMADTQRLLEVIFARWSLVMVDFERNLYADPEQDLNALWWDLVELHQLVHRPDGRDAPDWATKIHIVTAPVYYHNYLMGEMMASQMLAAMARDLYDGQPFGELDTCGNPAVGAWLGERIFAPGERVPWNELVENATGEPLTAKYFVEQYLGE
ncbi:MAG: M2 family metallopeptidase [Pseudomonadota bacterium]